MKIVIDISEDAHQKIKELVKDSAYKDFELMTAVADGASFETVLQNMRKEIKAYRVDHDQTEEYNDGFDDGVSYSLDIMDKYIAEAQT